MFLKAHKSPFSRLVQTTLSRCNMSHFAQFTLKNDSNNEIKVGYLNEDKTKLLDISKNYSSIDQMIKDTNGAIENAHLNHSEQSYLLEDITFKSPFYNPSKIVCVGKNYVEHAIETGEGIPKEPVIFNKFQSSITSHNSHINIPKIGATVDWEGELAVIIGKEAYNVKKENALDYVAGYTIANDVSARDWQKKRNLGQWLIGKSFNTFCPLGPYFIPKHHIGGLDEVHSLDIKTTVNQKVMQSSNTKNMAFNVAFIIEWVTQFSTLNVGDVILTGTPDGCGGFMKPPVFLKAGDVVEVEIEKLGKLVNNVVDEA